MNKIFLTIALFFSLNSNATLDDRTWCDGRIIHWNLYQVSFEPFNDASNIGAVEFWMGFHRNGSMIPAIYWWSWDNFTESTNIILYGDPLTYLNMSHNTSSFSRGCYATLKITGYNPIGPYDFTILGAGFISRDNSDLYSDADYFTLNNAVINYGGLEKKGKLTFTQIR